MTNGQHWEAATPYHICTSLWKEGLEATDKPLNMRQLNYRYQQRITTTFLLRLVSLIYSFNFTSLQIWNLSTLCFGGIGNGGGWADGYYLFICRHTEILQFKKKIALLENILLNKNSWIKKAFPVRWKILAAFQRWRLLVKTSQTHK